MCGQQNVPPSSPRSVFMVRPHWPPSNKEGASGKDTPQASCRGYGGLIALAGLQDRKGMGIYQRGFSGGKRLHVATDQLNVIPTITFVGQHLEFKHGHGYCSSIRCSNRQRLFSLTYSTSG
ncbi:hypothetical protein AFE_3119 [Acidithiobacillus ferrooxidans ATCC 23270]|uniref:Uncharacterized protein n=1 Tax=Acidithiobacillus ferrooxidans (strain ATCC 23270 / DSM 14882 / CIP 104768 / NCIMB 8455) TaxID=243159 RepID=B7JAM3_ACIF2|nr:hypothetical protein AFE_3119 [Acidithiobacillus ferrooxidans ATCC 23270]